MLREPGSKLLAAVLAVVWAIVRILKGVIVISRQVSIPVLIPFVLFILTAARAARAEAVAESSLSTGCMCC
jgi:hypothetical protein